MKKVYEVNLFELEVGNLVLFHSPHGFLLILEKKPEGIKVLDNGGLIISHFSNDCIFRLSRRCIDEGLCYWII